MSFSRWIPARMLLGLMGLGLAGVTSAWAAGIGFRNDLNGPVIVQGASIVNGMVRRGPPIVIPAGQIGWDNKLPRGTRFISIYDANQPNRVLIRDLQIPFQGPDLLFSIRASAGKIGVEPVKGR